MHHALSHIVRTAAALPLLLAFAALIAACSGDTALPVESPSPEPTTLSHIVSSPEAGRTALRCEECELVEVIEVTSPATVLTDKGEIKVYGAFIMPESELCVQESTERLSELAGTRMRIEEGPQLRDSRGTQVRYLYTESGDSIDEALIAGGTARLSALDGQHMPWLLFQADEARVARNGCLWEEFDRLFGGTQD